MKRSVLFIACSLFFTAFNSCQKDQATQAIDDVAVSQQETQAEEILSDVDLLVDEAIDANTSQLKSANASLAYLTDCPVITLDTSSDPQVLTIDFGTSCTGRDGKVRSGKIVVTSTSFKTFPSVRDKTFDNYYVDGNKVEGTVTKTIEKDQVNNIRTATLQEDVTITFADGAGTAHRVANLTRQYQRGALLNPLDNRVVSWGTVEFTRVSGVTVNKTIPADTPLVFKTACHQIVSGIVTVTTSNNVSWTIDYGNGDCDNQATLTRNGKTRQIVIR